MSNQKTIVCDIDDTISITTNRDWENAKPVQKVIDKLNSLYDLGWEILLVTARGSLSCASRAEADEKYRNQITEWLRIHNVKYTNLSFDKQLAAYYVDDKSITPEQFVELEITNLQNGWSGATVELRGDNRVYKTHRDSMQAAAWYDIAKSFFNVPEVHSLIGETISMEFIKPTSNVIKLDDVIDILVKMKDIQFISGDQNWFGSYMERLTAHVLNNDVPDFESLFTCYEEIQQSTRYINFNKYGSFCHGDLTIENLINHNGKLYMIDPIYEVNKPTWSSWLLDASKFLFSLRRHKRFTEYYYMYDRLCTDIHFNLRSDILRLLEASHCIRVYKYAPESEKQSIIDMYNEIMSKIS